TLAAFAVEAAVAAARPQTVPIIRCLLFMLFRPFLSVASLEPHVCHRGRGGPERHARFRARGYGGRGSGKMGKAGAVPEPSNRPAGPPFAEVEHDREPRIERRVEQRQ